MATANEFDVVVIGAGPGGYIAAIRAAQLGLPSPASKSGRTQAGPAPGGTCTNVGCIPSKALLQSSENFEHAGHHFADHGIGVDKLTIDVAKMLARKKTVVKQNNDGIVFLFRKNKITLLQGRGKFTGKTRRRRADRGRRREARDAHGEERHRRHGFEGARICRARRSTTRTIPANEGALRIDAVPKKLAVIGAGVIGLELGSVWRRLGADVTVLEALPAFLGAADKQVANEAQKQFKKQGLNIQLGVKIGEVTSDDDGVTVAYTDEDGDAQTLDVDRLIVSIGRVPNTDRPDPRRSA